MITQSKWTTHYFYLQVKQKNQKAGHEKRHLFKVPLRLSGQGIEPWTRRLRVCCSTG